MQVVYWILSAVIGYALGCISTGLIVSKAYGRIDIRKYGSGNTGMTNVMRTLGWFPGVLSFLGDMLKGVLAACIGKMLAGDIGMCLGGLFAVIGHNWPAIFHFAGGKGISTSFGFILVLDWRIAVILFVVQMVILLSTGYMSLASIASSVVFVISTLIFWPNQPEFIITALIACAMSLFSHRSNIKRLLNHEENRLDHRKITEKSRQMAKKIKNRKKEHQ